MGRFNGGPGCSSFDGSLMEVGPLRLEPGSGGTLKEVEGAWNEYANLLFSKSPRGRDGPLACDDRLTPGPSQPELTFTLLSCS